MQIYLRGFQRRHRGSFSPLKSRSEADAGAGAGTIPQPRPEGEPGKEPSSPPGRMALIPGALRHILRLPPLPLTPGSQGLQWKRCFQVLPRETKRAAGARSGQRSRGPGDLSSALSQRAEPEPSPRHGLLTWGLGWVGLGVFFKIFFFIAPRPHMRS